MPIADLEQQIVKAEVDVNAAAPLEKENADAKKETTVGEKDKKPKEPKAEQVNQTCALFTSAVYML